MKIILSFSFRLSLFRSPPRCTHPLFQHGNRSSPSSTRSGAHNHAVAITNLRQPPLSYGIPFCSLDHSALHILHIHVNESRGCLHTFLARLYVSVRVSSPSIFLPSYAFAVLLLPSLFALSRRRRWVASAFPHPQNNLYLVTSWSLNFQLASSEYREAVAPTDCNELHQSMRKLELSLASSVCKACKHCHLEVLPESTKLPDGSKRIESARLWSAVLQCHDGFDSLQRINSCCINRRNSRNLDICCSCYSLFHSSICSKARQRKRQADPEALRLVTGSFAKAIEEGAPSRLLCDIGTHRASEAVEASSAAHHLCSS